MLTLFASLDITKSMQIYLRRCLLLCFKISGSVQRTSTMVAVPETAHNHSSHPKSLQKGYPLNATPGWSAKVRQAGDLTFSNAFRCNNLTAREQQSYSNTNKSSPKITYASVS